MFKSALIPQGRRQFVKYVIQCNLFIPALHQRVYESLHHPYQPLPHQLPPLLSRDSIRFDVNMRRSLVSLTSIAIYPLSSFDKPEQTLGSRLIFVSELHVSSAFRGLRFKLSRYVKAFFWHEFLRDVNARAIFAASYHCKLGAETWYMCLSDHPLISWRRSH